ncbi:MAG: hypothetical protein IJO24_08565 [Clostridia bacterium]|nr:hypothetical protein [Clostridia bacterium]
MKRENKIAVSLSAIWVAWVYIPLILCVARLEYPKMTDSVFGIVFMLILCVPSVVCLIYSFFCKFEYKKVLYKIIYAFFAIFFISNTVFTFINVLCFEDVNVFYDVISETTKAENYLKIDDGIIDDETLEVVKYVFPEKIPDGAQNVEYYYLGDPGGFSMAIYADWQLNVEEYSQERIRYKSPGKIVDGVCYYSHSSEERYLIIGFDDATGTVKRTFLYGDYAPTERMVEGVGELYDAYDLL